MPEERVLAVIPARGGSKGIPRKNMRVLNGKPLIFYAIKTALGSRFISDVLVSSDDPEIQAYSSRFPVMVRDRPKALSGDDITLDPVVYDAVNYAERLKRRGYDIVITLQPTSPLLSVGSLDGAIARFRTKGLDTMLPVVDATHLYWVRSNGRLVPDFKERLNRQLIPQRLKETGSFLITRREFVRRNSRFGPNVKLQIVDQIEGVDIDGPIDWIVASSLIKRIRVVFVVTGNSRVALGHVYRCLGLADRMIGHDVTFVALDSDTPAIEIIESRGYAVRKGPRSEAIQLIRKSRPTLIINDILDTERSYMERLVSNDPTTVNFEDLGEGADIADLVFNALYEKSDPKPNHRFGFKYECLDDRFLAYPAPPFRPVAETLLVTFGGVDQNDLSSVVVRMIPEIARQSAIRSVNVVVGLGYAKIASLVRQVRIVKHKSKKTTINLHRNVVDMPRIMSSSDVAVTSNGRTLYELAAMGIPSVSVAQNDRETLHLFARYQKGVKYLGMAPSVEDKTISRAIVEVCNKQQLRKSMHEAQLKDGEVIRQGTSRVLREIMGLAEERHG
jgi:CMP-N-acetylneuraminic acid synthetase